MPDPKTAQHRQDNRFETSINWEDDDGALPFTKAMPNTKGVAELKRTTIDDISRKPGSLNAISYIRSELPDNKYHGDILFQAGLPNGRIRMIASSLALDASPA